METKKNIQRIAETYNRHQYEKKTDGNRTKRQSTSSEPSKNSKIFQQMLFQDI